LRDSLLPQGSHTRRFAPALLAAQIGGDGSQGGIKCVAANGGQGCFHGLIGRDYFELRSLALQTLSLLIQGFQ
jgi:hypothetical protein